MKKYKYIYKCLAGKVAMGLQPKQRSLLSAEIQKEGPFLPIPKQRTPVRVRYDAHVYVPHSRVRRKLVYPPQDEDDEVESEDQCCDVCTQRKRLEQEQLQGSDPSPWTLRALWAQRIDGRPSEIANELMQLRQAVGTSKRVEFASIPHGQNLESPSCEDEVTDPPAGLLKRVKEWLLSLKRCVARGMKGIRNAIVAGLKHVVDKALEYWLL